MKTALVLILSLSCAQAWAQTGTVTGHITDETGGALPGVTVELKGTDEPIVAVTDGEGHYTFDNMTAGTYQLSIRLINFATVTHSDLVVTAGKTTAFNDVMHLVLSAEVVVIGKRTFTNLADVENPAEDLVGIATSAGQGAITARQLEVRPFMRQGEVLETVPGVIITQHSGEGKANQYFLRGFNLDHGSDFALTVAGTPVNMPTHAHSQGYSDINFLIPELVAGVQYSKGPYFADQGDFATAGAGNITYATSLDAPPCRDRHIRVRARLRGRVAKDRQWNRACGVRELDKRRSLDRARFVQEAQRGAALRAGRQRQRFLAHRDGLSRRVERHGGLSAARNRFRTHRPVRIDRPDRWRAHLSLQRGRRMAARHRRDADQDSGLWTRLRPESDLKLYVLPG